MKPLCDTYIQYGVPNNMARKYDSLRLSVSAFRATPKESLIANYNLNEAEIDVVKNCINRKPIDAETIKVLLEKNNYLCCLCKGKKSDAYIIHHIKEYSTSQNNSYENLAVLCPNDHDLAHREGISLTYRITKDQIRHAKLNWEIEIAKYNADKAGNRASAEELTVIDSLLYEIETYKSNFIKDISTINILTIVKPRDLLDSFVELSFDDGYVDPEINTTDYEAILSENVLDTIGIIDFIPEGLVILGEAGSGKSTFLKQIAINHSEHMVPILINSKHINMMVADKDEVNIGLFVRQIVKFYGVELSQADVEHLIKSSPILLMVDGLDEIPEDIRSIFLEELLSFHHSHELHNIVLTTRIAGYKKGKLNKFHHVTIRSFDGPKIKQFVLKWFDKVVGAKFETYIFDPENTELFHLAGNPLLLTMMVGVFERNNYMLPKTISDLYRLFTHIMLSALDEKEKDIKRNRIPEQVKDSFLQQIGYKCLTDRLPNGLIPAAILNTISITANYSNETLLDEIIINSGLLLRDFLDYKLWHPSLADYYCAKYIAGRSIETELLCHLDDVQWRATHVFYFGVSSQPEVMLTAIMKKQQSEDDYFKSLLSLLGNCFVEGFYRENKYYYKTEVRTLDSYKHDIFQVLETEAFYSKYSYIRNLFLKILSKFNELEVYDAFHNVLIECLKSEEYQRMKEILSFIGHFPYSLSVKIVKELIDNPQLDKNVKSYAIYSLASYPYEANINFIRQIVENEEAYQGIVRSAATIVLGRFSKETAYRILDSTYHNEKLYLDERVRAAGSLVRAGREECIEFLKNVVILPSWLRRKIKVRPNATRDQWGSRRNRSDATLTARKSALIALSYVSRPDITEFFRDILSLGIMPEKLSSNFVQRRDWMMRQQQMSDGAREFEALERNLRKETIRLLPRLKLSDIDTRDNILFLHELLKKEGWNIAKEEILFSLGRLGDDSILAELLSIAQDETIGLRRRKAALVGIANMKSDVNSYLESIAFNLTNPLADMAFSCLAFRVGLLKDEFLLNS